MLVDEAFIDEVMPSHQAETSLLTQLAVKAQAAIQNMEDFADDLERRVKLFKENMEGSIDEAKEIVLVEPFPQLEAMIDHLERKEKQALRRLLNYRDMLAKRPQAVMPLTSDLFRRLDQMMVLRCETFRDARWELIKVRAEAPVDETPVFITSMADLRKARR